MVYAQFWVESAWVIAALLLRVGGRDWSQVCRVRVRGLLLGDFVTGLRMRGRGVVMVYPISRLR